MLYRLLASVFFASLSMAACSSSSSPPPPTNGVDDVLQACQIRAAWKGASASSCSTCIGLATTPRCPCTDQDYAGKCSEQQTARTNEPNCAGVDDCVGKCVRTDCACIDGCYAKTPTCRTRASAVDGCVAEICQPHCQ